MGTEFENYADLHGGVTGDTIRAAADDPNQDAIVIAALASELGEDEQHVAADIEGDIEAGTRANPQTSQQVATNLAQSGYYAVGLLNEFAGHVDTFDAGVEDLNTRLRSDVASAMRYAGQGAAATGDEPPTHQETWSSIKASMQPEYNRLDNALEDHAESIASRFEQGPTPENVKELVVAGLIPFSTASGLWPALTLNDDERRQALQNEVAHMTPEEQAAWVRANSEIGPEVVEVITDEAQQILAAEVAADVQEPTEIDGETVRLLDLFKEEEAFTTELYTTVSPDEMADAIKHLNYAAFNGTLNIGHAESQPALDLYDGFMNAAGIALATHSRNTPSPSALADDYYAAITSDDPMDRHNGAALTLLMREGGEHPEGVFEAGFLGKLTDDVLDWERSHDGEPVWNPDQIGIFDPDVSADEYGNYNGRHGGDGLANLLGAMGHSPEAAQQFFGDGNGGIDGDKLDYLIGTKDGDDVNARTFSFLDGSDEGDGLGEALEAAGVRNGDDPSSHAWSGEFATDVFNRIADLSGHGDKTGIDDPLGVDDVWHVWPDMADNLGNIAAGYAPDVYDIVDGSGGQSLNVSNENLDKVLGEIGRGDKSGIETLTTAIVLEGNNRLDQEIQDWKAENPGQPVDMEAIISGNLGSELQGRSGTNGEILGHVINQAITVDEHDESLAATRAAYASKAIDIVGGFIPGGGSILGEGASHLATSAIDVTKSEGLAALKGAVGDTPSATGGQWHDAARGEYDATLENQVTTQLINSGVLTVGNDGGGSQIPESLTVRREDGSIALNPDVFGPAGPDTTGQIGEEGQYTAAEQEQMREDMRIWLESDARNYNELIAQSGQNGLDREMNK